MFKFEEGCVYKDTVSFEFPNYSSAKFEVVRRTPKTITIKSLNGFDGGCIFPRQKIRYDEKGNEFVWLYSRRLAACEIKAEYLISEQ